MIAAIGWETMAKKMLMMPSGKTMLSHLEISDQELRNQIRQKQIYLERNDKLKIYVLLKCRSGKRMKKENRVFFRARTEAIRLGFRPCGHCLASDYKKWKNGFI